MSVFLLKFIGMQVIIHLSCGQFRRMDSHVLGVRGTGNLTCIVLLLLLVVINREFKQQRRRRQREHQKINRLNKQNNNSARELHFLGHFFAVTARLGSEMS